MLQGKPKIVPGAFGNYDLKCNHKKNVYEALFKNKNK